MHFFHHVSRRPIRSSESVLHITLVLCAFVFVSQTAYAQLSAGFTMSKDKGCAPLFVQFTNTSTGNQDSCFWDLGINGNTSDDCSPSAIFNQPGTYNVTLTIFKGSQKSTITKQVTVFHDPVSAFDATPRTGCVPFNVQFKDLSKPGDAPIKNWLWDMGDGRTETTQDPLHTYTFSGNLTVSLIVTDANGCKNTLTVPNFIQKATPPEVDFSVNKAHTCLVPFNAVFQSTIVASTPVTYTWYFGTGDSSSNANPAYTYNAAGSYNVTLTVKDQNNCVNSKTVNNAVVIDKLKLNAVIPTPLCTNTSGTPSVSCNYNPVSYKWDLGNGNTSSANTPALAYTTPGTYAVNVVATNPEGCRDSASQNVVVNLAPEAAFTADQTKSCVPFTVNLTNTSSNAVSYKWIISSPNGTFITSTLANPSINLPKKGIYDVTLTVTSATGCTDKLYMPQYIWIGSDELNATADKTEGCADLTVHFDAGLTHHWIPKNIIWNFGDGSTGTGESPTHTYTQQGDYYITVKVIYDAPCDSLYQRIGPIQVGERVPFNGSFDLTKVCVHRETVTYTATGGLPTTVFTWIYGDGSGTGANTTHIYNDPSEPKSYLVQLIAENHYCKDTLNVGTIFVAYPKADFDYVSTCNSQTVTFTNLSKGHTSATWYFGDGSTLVSMDNSVTHTYPPNVTQVTASLMVYNDVSGCTDTLAKNIRFASIDSVSYSLSADKGCAPLKVSFKAPIDTNIQNYIWERGDGTNGFGANYTTTYNNEGSYIIKLFVKYKNGCLIASSVRDTINVLAAHANFTFDKNSGCVPALFNFRDSSYAKNSSITSYQWSFDNNTTASGPAASHTYNAVGSFPVRLTVQSAEGCRDSVVKKVKVAEVSADFDIDVNGVCGGKPIHFINKASVNAVTYLWDFGDGTTSTEQEPTHAYSQERNYTVSLKVTDGKGCENTMTKPGFVHIKNIHVDFTATPRFKTCPDMISNFQLLTPPSMMLDSIKWDFGNGNISNDNNRTPQGVYTKADSFDIKLIVVDNNHCTDTVFKPAYIVVSGPQGSFSFDPDFGCAPFDVKFNANFKNTTTTIWDFGNGDTKLDRSLATSTTYTYRREGEFTPTLVLKDDYGCTVNIISKKKINVARLLANFNIAQRNVCSGTGRIAINDTFYSTPNSPLKDYYWAIEDSAHRITRGVGDTFIPTSQGSYQLRLYAENTYGCIVRDSVTIGVYNRPVVSAVDDKLICKGEQISLKVSGNPDHVEWSPSASLNTSSGMDVMARPDTSTSYIIKAYNYPQCPVYDTVKVTVKTKLDARAFPDTSVCIGDTVQLHALAENTSLNMTRISWLPSPSISSTTEQDVLAYPLVNTTYYALIENGACQTQKIPVQVDVRPNPSVSASDDQLLMRGSGVEIDAISPDQVQYHWSPDYKLSCTDCQNPVASPEQDTSYIVTAINKYGCKAVDRLNIRVIEDCSGNTIFVPNTFSPNGDGQNDVLRVLGPGVASVKEFRVFNRWGQMVFSSTDTNVGWDGTFNGQELNPGVYMYYMDVECINGQRSVKKGDVTLLR